jgi:hypothetical protein
VWVVWMGLWLCAGHEIEVKDEILHFVQNDIDDFLAGVAQASQSAFRI